MSLISSLRARWSQLAPREKSGLAWATTLVAGALLWTLVVAPARTTLLSAPAQHRTLDAQLARMQQMQAQAASLKAQPAPGFDEAVRTLTAATRQALGAGVQINVTGQQANVTMTGVPADALAQWLGQARQNARSVPLEARLTRVAAADGAVTWNGTVVMSLPVR